MATNTDSEIALNFDRLRQTLSTFPLKDFELHHRIESTNTHLKSSQFQNNTLCLVETQTAGRGRDQKAWQSPPFKNIYLSLKVAVDNTEMIHRLPITISIYLCQWLSTLGIQPKIKWPNDIFANDRKLGGILVEAITHGQKTFLIIGIGLNVNMESNNAIEKSWTSLANLTQQYWDRNALILPLVQALFSAINQHQSLNLSEKFKLYDYLSGKIITIQTDSGLNKGVMNGINDEGQLILKHNDQNITFQNGSIVKF